MTLARLMVRRAGLSVSIRAPLPQLKCVAGECNRAQWTRSGAVLDHSTRFLAISCSHWSSEPHLFIGIWASPPQHFIKRWIILNIKDHSQQLLAIGHISIMFLKRKRSNSELTSPMRPSSVFSTPQSCATQYNTHQFTYDITPPHLSSRTRKRVRDNRPAKEAIHRMSLPVSSRILHHLRSHN